MKVYLMPLLVGSAIGTGIGLILMNFVKDWEKEEEILIIDPAKRVQEKDVAFEALCGTTTATVVVVPEMLQVNFASNLNGTWSDLPESGQWHVVRTSTPSKELCSERRTATSAPELFPCYGIPVDNQEYLLPASGGDILRFNVLPGGRGLDILFRDSLGRELVDEKLNSFRRKIYAGQQEDLTAPKGTAFVEIEIVGHNWPRTYFTLHRVCL
jgi:hypothetical protein